MNSSQLNGSTKGFGISLAVSVVFSALLVVVKETNEGLMKLMKTVTVHHWVTHSLVFVGLFLVLGFVLSKSNDGKGVNVSDEGLLKTVIGSNVLGAAIIAAFYLAEL